MLTNEDTKNKEEQNVLIYYEMEKMKVSLVLIDSSNSYFYAWNGIFLF